MLQDLKPKLSDHFKWIVNNNTKQKCVWLIWGERNNKIFNNVETPIIQLLDKVKFHSLWWLKAGNITFVYGSQSWWSDPMRCLGLD